MQGNERNRQEIDEQFISDAWLAMKDMLDQEMPVVPPPEGGNNSRRWLLWLGLFLIGFGLGAGTWYWYGSPQTQESPAPLVPVAVDGPHAQVESSGETNNSMVSLAPDSPSTANTDDPSSNNSIANSSTNTTASENNTTLNPSPPSSNSISNSTALPDNEVQFRWTPPTSITNAATEQSDPIEFRWTNPTGNAPATKPLEKAIAVSPIPPLETVVPEIGKDDAATLATPSLDWEELEETAAAKTVDDDLLAAIQPEPLADILPEFSPKLTTVSPTSRWNWGVRGSVLRDNGTRQFSGANAGMVVNYHLNRRFALQTGIELHHLVKSSNSNENFNEVATTNFSMGDLRGGAVGDLQAGDLNEYFYERATLRNLNYLKLPLQLAYKLNQKVRINTGVNVGYLLRNSNGFDGPGISNLDSEAYTAASREDDLLLKGLKTLDYGLQLGISFHPTEKLGLDLTYNIGLQDFTKNDYFGFIETHTNRYLGLGLTYYFFNR